MKIEKFKIKDLISPDYNPREITPLEMEKLKRSIKEFDYVDPIIINSYNNHIIGGNQRFEAMKQLGYDEIEVSVVNIPDPNREKALNLRLNKLSGDWDIAKLNDIIQELEINHFDLSITGFDDFDEEIEFNKIEYENPNNPPKKIIEDEYNQEDIEVTVKKGDIYQLHNHRLMCGDSTKKEDVQKLLNNTKIDLLFTDPPYNVAFNGRSGKFEVIKNDNLDEKNFEKFILKIIQIIKDIDPEIYYIWCNWKFYGILQQNLPFKNCIVWAKNVFGLGKGYRHQHEFCLFNGTIDKDIRNESDLWEVKKDSKYMHPTQKPVELCARALKNSKDANNILDLFGGSGSTLIACEQMLRNAYIMEIDPYYCQIIINRWEEFTGRKAEKKKK